MTHAANVWNPFCQRFKVVEQSVPLFSTDADGVVAHRMLGRIHRRPCPSGACVRESV